MLNSQIDFLENFAKLLKTDRVYAINPVFFSQNFALPKLIFFKFLSYYAKFLRFLQTFRGFFLKFQKILKFLVNVQGLDFCNF